MNKIYHFILFCFATLCLAACSDDDPEVSGIDGKDHFISEFALTVDGITYQAMIVGDKITIEIPYNASLKGATVEYALCEGASINPNPSTIEDWENEWKFVVTSKMQDSKVYSYTYQYTDIEQSGCVVLATQAEVDNFAKTGINKIEGSLTIGTADGEEITNLDGLANLKQISNSLVINPSYKGTDLTGLDNLEQLGSFKLGSTAAISKNTTLKAVNLPSLLGVTGDFVVNSSVIEKISIPKVEIIGEDMYIVSDALLDLDANAVESVGASLIVKGSTVQKATAVTEAIVFASLKHIGNDFSVQYFPKLQGIYLPVLENVSGSVSFANLSLVGNIAMTELCTIGGLDISQCVNLSTIELPKLVSSGAFKINASQLNKLNVPSLTNVTGDMYLSNVLLRELDLSRIEFNGNTLKLELCGLLGKLAGPETFNGNLVLARRTGNAKEGFSIEGFSILNGNFEATQTNFLDNLIIPFISVTGNVIAETIYGDRNIPKKIKFPYLQEIGGELRLDQLNNIVSVELPVLKTIGGTCYISVSQQSGNTVLQELENIGSKIDDAQITFVVASANIECPKLKTITGNFLIEIYEEATEISYPNLEIISNNMTIQAATWADPNELITNIDFSNLKSAKSINISEQKNVTDFSSFKYLFENNVLTGESQWSVKECGYNPTFQDMKDGKYKPAE